jgi:hypothetical protein
MADFLSRLLTIATLAFAVSSMLSVGFSYTLRELLEPLRNARLVIGALVANFVLVPLLAYAVTGFLSLGEGREDEPAVIDPAVSYMWAEVDLSHLWCSPHPAEARPHAESSRVDCHGEREADGGRQHGGRRLWRRCVRRSIFTVDAARVGIIIFFRDAATRTRSEHAD